MAKQQKRKARPSWFQRQIERDGEEFLNRKQPFDIQREAFNIIRDITRGNITPRDFKYLFTTKVLSNVRIAVYEEYLKCHTYNAAMTFSMNSQYGMQTLYNNFGVDDSNFKKFFNQNQNLLNAYILVIQSIDYMISAVQQTFTDDNMKNNYYLQVYGTIQLQLSRFKHII